MQTQTIKSKEDWRGAHDEGRTACRQGLYSQAIEAFKRAIELDGQVVEAHHDLGVALHQAGHFGEALECFEKATQLNDRMPQAWFHGGCTLCAMQRPAAAIPWFRRALQLKSDYADARYNLANALKATGSTKEAAENYQAALRLNPHLAEAYNNLGTLHLRRGLLDRALTCFQKALDLKPDDAQANYNLSLALERLGKISEAIACAQRCLQTHHEFGNALALLVSLFQQTCDWEALARAGESLEQLTGRQLQAGQRPFESPFLNFTRSTDRRRNRDIAASWSNWLTQSDQTDRTPFDFTNRRVPKNRLTIGYLSERFRNAATGHLMAGLFGRHDRQRYKIIAYSWGKNDASYYRRRIAQDVDEFVNIRSLSDGDAAERIHTDQVDILVDLMGWMQGNRIEIAARQPAPVQVSYLGYPATTGAPFIDYILADRIVIPPGHVQDYTEKVIWLPDCYHVTDPDTPVDPQPQARRSNGLPSEGFVFCAFGTDYKIEKPIFSAWMRILKAVPQSVLWLLVRSPEARENLRIAARTNDVQNRRLIFAKPLPKKKHLARLRLADLALDTPTVNGHTTTSDALWADVPVVTCQGTHFASRVASSILQAIGLDELVTHNLADYENLTIHLARDRQRIQQLKARLQQHKSRYPLFDVGRFVRGLEQAYQKMWRGYLEGPVPARPRAIL